MADIALPKAVPIIQPKTDPIGPAVNKPIPVPNTLDVHVVYFLH